MRHDWTLRRQTRASVARAEAVDDCGGSILYLDEQALTRDCIGRELARRLPEFKITDRASARDLSASDNPTKFALAILYVHADRVAFEARESSLDHTGIAAQLALLEEVAPDTPRVLMSELEVPEDILEAFRQRIRGYVPTTLPMKQVAEAIRFVAAGGTFVPLSILTLHGQPAAHQEEAQSPTVAAQLLDFSPRQNEVLQMLWNGCSNKLIAYELGMSESTVKVHIRHIMKKLHVSNRTQVVLRTRPDGRESDLHPKLPNLASPTPALPAAPIPEIRAILDQANGRPHERSKSAGMQGTPHRT
ncbi:MAG TPA: response regulator transcription factor [Dongiaceae bacterium]|jgi:DNA-binding NarL/FixJ family response regulator